MTNLPDDARFQVRKDGRKWFVTDALNEGMDVDGPYKTRHLAEESAAQLNADNPVEPDEEPESLADPERVAALVERIEDILLAPEGDEDAPSAPVVDQAAVDRGIAIIEAARAAAHDANDGIEFQPTVDVEPPADPAAMDRTERIVAAKAEVEAVRAWKAEACGDTEGPATPVLDWMADPANTVRKAPRSAKAVTAHTDEQLATIRHHISYGREQGLSWGKIAKLIEAEGIPTARGGQWYDTTASDLAKRLGIAS
jgi:hypothetical protein